MVAGCASLDPREAEHKSPAYKLVSIARVITGCEKSITVAGADRAGHVPRRLTRAGRFWSTSQSETLNPEQRLFLIGEPRKRRGRRLTRDRDPTDPYLDACSIDYRNHLCQAFSQTSLGSRFSASFPPP